MKKNSRFFCSLILVISFILSISEISAQVDIVSTPDTTAYLSLDYTDTVKAETLEPPITYSLVEWLDGMIINSTTGIITWPAPQFMGDGGKVIVKATNDVSEFDTQEFFIYVSDEIPCHPNLEAYWKLDETSGPVYEDWIGTNDAIAFANSPEDSLGIVDNSQSFDPANNEGLSVPRDTVFNWGQSESFSVELWFKNHVDHIDSNAVFIGRNEGPSAAHWWIGVVPDGTVNCFIRIYDLTYALCTSTTTVNDTDWHHVVMVRDNSTEKVHLYIDGSWEDDDDYDGTGYGLVSDSSINIGWLRAGPTEVKNYPYNGKIDELRLYNKALSSLEVVNSYFKGTQGKPGCRPGNFAPLYTSEPADTAFEEQSYSYTLTANDIDVGDIVSYDLIKKPGWVTYTAGTRTFSGIPTNSEVGADSVVTRISDGKVNIYQRFLLHVINTNDPPSITSSPVLTVLEETAYSYDVDADDIDAGDNLTFSAPVKPGWLSINPATGVLSGTPSLNDTSEYNVTVRVTDDSAAFDEQSFVIDVRNINDPPVITGPLPLDVDEDNSLLIQLSDIIYTDVDNVPGEMILTVNDGTNYTHAGNMVTPAENYHGTIDVPFELSDGEYTDTETLIITVNSVNDLPEITTVPDLVASENVQYIYLLAATDADVEDTLTFSSEKKPDWLSINPDNQVLSGMPDFFDIGTDSVVLKVTDGTANVYLRYVVEVMITNNIPYVTSTPATDVDEDTEYSYTVEYTDDDTEDVVILSGLIIPGWLTLNGDVLSGTPTNDQVGTEPFKIYMVKLRVTDNKQDSTQTFNITVNNINDAPEITGQPDTLLAYAGTSLVIGVSDLTVEDVDNVPGDLSVIVMAGSGYTPSGDTAKINPGTTGVININVRVTDGDRQSTIYNAYTRIFPGTGINEMFYSDNLVTKLYPVPASEYLMFELSSGNTGLDFELITMQGQTILKNEIEPGKDIFKLDVNNIPSGVYIYRFFNTKNYQTGIVTIQK